MLRLSVNYFVIQHFMSLQVLTKETIRDANATANSSQFVLKITLY